MAFLFAAFIRDRRQGNAVMLSEVGTSPLPSPRSRRTASAQYLSHRDGEEQLSRGEEPGMAAWRRPCPVIPSARSRGATRGFACINATERSIGCICAKTGGGAARRGGGTAHLISLSPVRRRARSPLPRARSAAGLAHRRDRPRFRRVRRN